MAVEIDEGAVDVNVRMTQGDGWPDEPIEIQITEDDESTPVTGVIASARLQVRESYAASGTLADLSSEGVDAVLVVSADGSQVTIPSGAVPGATTTDWPAVDLDLNVRAQTPCVWDLEVILVATSEPDTLAGGKIYVEPQATR